MRASLTGAWPATCDWRLACHHVCPKIAIGANQIINSSFAASRISVGFSHNPKPMETHKRFSKTGEIWPSRTTSPLAGCGEGDVMVVVVVVGEMKFKKGWSSLNFSWSSLNFSWSSLSFSFVKSKKKQHHVSSTYSLLWVPIARNGGLARRDYG